MRSIGLPELLIILAVAVLLFGGKKIPEVAKGLGEGIKNFKNALKTDDDKPEEKKKEKERDPFEDDREFKKLDKDLKRAFKELEKGGDFGKGYKQWMREQQGRLSPEHRSYTDAMAEQRLKDLMERFPDRKEDFERQLEELKQIDQDLKPVKPNGDKWRDFDALLGENWKAPEKELEQGKEQEAGTGAGNVIADRSGQDLAIDQIHAEASGDQTKIEQEKEIDDGFDRGLG